MKKLSESKNKNSTKNQILNSDQRALFTIFFDKLFLRKNDFYFLRLTCHFTTHKLTDFVTYAREHAIMAESNTQYFTVQRRTLIYLFIV